MKTIDKAVLHYCKERYLIALKRIEDRKHLSHEQVNTYARELVHFDAEIRRISGQ